MTSSTSRKTQAIEQSLPLAHSRLPPHVKHHRAGRPVRVCHNATPQGVAAHLGATCVLSCSSCSCNLAPVLQHLQQPRSSETARARESSAVATSEAPAASAARDRQPPRQHGSSGSATFKQAPRSNCHDHHHDHPFVLCYVMFTLKTGQNVHRYAGHL